MGSEDLADSVELGNGFVEDDAKVDSSYVPSSLAPSHGWQKVVDVKKQRREQKKKEKEKEKTFGLVGDGEKLANGVSESKGFKALEKEVQERKLQKEARRAAAAAAAVEVPTVQSSDGSDEEGEFHKPVNGEIHVEVKKAKKAKKPKISVADAASRIVASDLVAFLSEISERFQESPDIQLVRCADYFVDAFKPVTPSQFSWEKISKEPLSKIYEVPLRDIPEEICKVTSDWFCQKPLESLSKFSILALNEVMDETPTQHGKGSKSSQQPSLNKTKVGMFTLLALLLRAKPEVLQQPSIKPQLSQIQGQDKLSILAWAYSQAAQGDLVVGASLWVQYLLPAAVGKTSTPVSRDIALQFFESILLGSSNAKKARTILLSGASKKGERLVPPATLDAVLHAAFPPSPRTKAGERFYAIYPLVKELALAGVLKSKSTRPVAQQLLPLSMAAVAEDASDLAEEAFTIFRWCLLQNPDCYKQWEKLHMDNIKASNKILHLLCREWKESETLLAPLDSLKNTLQVLRSKHQKALGEKGSGIISDIKVADNYCKVLQGKLSRFPACLKASVTVVSAVGVAYAFYLLNPNVNPWNWDGKIFL